ncbi:nucleotide sugar dehydrogenase [Streptomyces sp. NPDC054794]
MDTKLSPDDGYTAVIGLGYVGLPLAAALAAAGSRVVGIDQDPAVRAAVEAGTPLFREPGLPELLAEVSDRFTVTDKLPDARPGAVIVCVGTPPEPGTNQANLTHLRSAVGMFAHAVDAHCPVVIRSTVPVGTCREVVLPELKAHQDAPLLAFCPERTIQGRALAEIRSLPQIIGGLDQRAAAAASRLLAPVVPERITVSSLETAEMIKLVCNSHTDLIYGFGNEVALIAEALGLDASEVIASANLRYPRPDIARPGFVGGSCLVKDPYMLLDAARRAGHEATLVASARALNERVPEHAVQQVLTALAARGVDLADATVIVCGIAYKGRPETDDVRGSAATSVQNLLANRVARLLGHDFVVADSRVSAMGFEPSELADGLSKADAVLLLSDHPGYALPDVAGLLASSPVVFDMWGMWEDALADTAGIEYMRLGRG